MGRLFWKFFFAFWSTLLTAGLTVGLAVGLIHGNRNPVESLASGPRASFIIDTAVAALANGGVDALQPILVAWSERAPEFDPVYVVDANGREILGRQVSAALLEKAREAARRQVSGASPPPGQDRWAGAAQEVASPEGSLLVFVSEESLARTPSLGGHPGHHLPPGMPEPRLFPPDLPLISGLLASLAFSALLAWHFSKPVRLLRWALGAVAAGRLETRVQPLMGSRRDEIADLGRDFDRMTEELQHLVTAQRRLLHDVSHELRSPLARLQAAIGLARQDPRRMATTLERIERESQRLDKLVGEILTLARLEAGADCGPMMPLDLVELLAAVVDDVRFEAEARERALHWEPHGECLLTGYGELLHRAFENILRNAVQHTPKGTAVEVSMVRLDDGQVRVSIHDRGPGVRPGDLDAIFSPFYRGSSGLGGFGLGLAIARRAVEAHGGAVSAHNGPAGGLCVNVVLPTA